MLCKNGVEAMQEWRGSNVRMAWKQRKNGVETMQEWRGDNAFDAQKDAEKFADSTHLQYLCTDLQRVS